MMSRPPNPASRLVRPLAGSLGIALLLLVACSRKDRDEPVDHDQKAGGECGGRHVGKWAGVTADDGVIYAADCSYTYRGPDGCTEKGTYARAMAGTGRVQVRVTESTGGDCYSKGTYTCEYSLSQDTLTYDCGEGRYTYRRD